jgi:hypothetical protein
MGRGIAVIEGYRQQNGVEDRRSAFGAEPKATAELSIEGG